MAATATTTEVSLPEFVDRARGWLDANASPLPPPSELRWGVGSDDVSVFQTLTDEEERAQVREYALWQQRKSDAGFGSIAWPTELGGAGLSRAHEAAYRKLERGYAVPDGHEVMASSMDIVAPTIRSFGTEEQQARWVAALRRAELVCCQLFSEPGAGSDLGSLSTRAEPDGDEWVVNGQKVWTTGARVADLGYLIARTDPTAPRATACSAFILDMDSPGVEVRPLKQMNGAASFNEVFFTDVRIADANRLGDVGAGWAAAMASLGFERVAGSGGRGGGSSASPFDLLLLTACHLGRTSDPLVRQALAEVWMAGKVRGLTNRRAAAGMRAGGVPGPEGSIGKLAYTNGLGLLGQAASLLVGPSLVADTGEWGTFAWSELLTSAPGMRIAGGTDEIQRNTIAERVLGLPREPR